MIMDMELIGLIEEEKGEWIVIQANILKYEIKPILARVNHPQTNGKIEKWFHTYENSEGFSTFEDSWRHLMLH